jgi:uncharacterized membrane protein YqjE
MVSSSMSSYGSSQPLASSGSSGSAPRVIVEALVHRGELASLELREAQQHGFRTAVMIGFAAVLVLLGGVAGTFALAAAVWQREDRGLILSLVTLGYFVGAAVFAYVASRRLRNWSPFAESCRQFHADCECLHEVIANATR